MFSTRFWYTSAAITIILAIHLAAFPAQSQDSRPVVRLSIPGTDTVYSTPYRIAQERGFYADEKIELQILGGVRTGPSVQMLVAGTVEATQTVGPTTLAAIVRGAPLKIVMVFNDKPSYWLYSKKNVRSFADLKGTKVASSTPGSTNDRLLKIVLEKKGVELAERPDDHLYRHRGREIESAAHRLRRCCGADTARQPVSQGLQAS